MLMQLLKYEFKASARQYGGAYLALLGTAGALGLWARYSPQDLEALGAALGLAYMAVIIAIVVLTVEQIITRFTKNLLGPEGYLMHTLPVTSGQLIAAKLLSSAVWGTCSLCVGVGSVFLLMLAAQPGMLGELLRMLRYVADYLPALGNMVSLAAGLFVLLVSWAACAVLRIYTSCMLGHQLPRYMVPAGILSFFALTSAQGGLETLVASGAGWLGFQLLGGAAWARTGPLGGLMLTGAAGSGYGGFWLMVLGYAALQAVFSAGYFLAADWLMRRRLNLG